jgi:hypothetical protein
MARGVLIVDEHLLTLIPSLEDKRFKVYSLARGICDDQIGPLLAHRVLVASNGEAFREAAAIHEFSIIDTANYDQDTSALAREISRAWMRLGLRRKQPFMLKLMRAGEPVLSDIE